MNQNTINTPNEQLKAFIPQALKTAITRYSLFSCKIEREAVDYKKQQEACKVAIAHIELLIKLSNANQTQTPEAQGIDREELNNIMQKAHAEVEAYNEQKRQKEQQRKK